MRKIEAERIILKPILTEKSNKLREMKEKKYSFIVSKRANKLMIEEAMKELFKVTPKKCNIINTSEKPKAIRGANTYKRGTGYTTSIKKAIITLPKDQKIDVFENV